MGFAQRVSVGLSLHSERRFRGSERCTVGSVHRDGRMLVYIGTNRWIDVYSASVCVYANASEIVANNAAVRPSPSPSPSRRTGPKIDRWVVPDHVLFLF